VEYLNDTPIKYNSQGNKTLVKVELHAWVCIPNRQHISILDKLTTLFKNRALSLWCQVVKSRVFIIIPVLLGLSVDQ
ncbi:33785_t:CDS:1, partial [Racocetra persica]